MSARDELAEIIGEHLDHPAGPNCPSCADAYRSADAILAAGYSKPCKVTLWGVAFVHNGAFYKEYRTKEDAQKFADEMTEAGAHMRVVTREYVPAIYGEWIAA